MTNETQRQAMQRAKIREFVENNQEQRLAPSTVQRLDLHRKQCDDAYRFYSLKRREHKKPKVLKSRR